jgi:hypothetical protein
VTKQRDPKDMTLHGIVSREPYDPYPDPERGRVLPQYVGELIDVVGEDGRRIHRGVAPSTAADLIAELSAKTGEKLTTAPIRTRSAPGTAGGALRRRLDRSL